jgi:hypothetical protein
MQEGKERQKTGTGAFHLQKRTGCIVPKTEINSIIFLTNIKQQTS